MHIPQRVRRVTVMVGLLMMVTSLTLSSYGSKPAAAAVGDISPDGYEEVYGDSFSSGFIDDHWGESRVAAQSPVPYSERFLWGYNPYEHLTVSDLPPHSKIRLTFDLYVIDDSHESWVGNYSDHRFQVDETATFAAPNFNYTFSNVARASYDQNPLYGQTYPGLGQAVYPPKTGALPQTRLGYLAESTYQVALIFDHTDSDFHAYFRSTRAHANKLNYWGLDNVKVEFLNATMPALQVAFRNSYQRYLADGQGNRVRLRGLGIPDLEYVNTYRRGGVPALINRITAHDGANDPAGWYPRVLRLPVYPEPDSALNIVGWNDDPDGYLENHLDPAVRHCVSKQVYCIIDWHWVTSYQYQVNPEGDPNGENEVIDEEREQAIADATWAFWDVVARKYKNHPNVIFELFNEPIYPLSWTAWKTTAQPWIDLIRNDIGATNIIIVGAPHWSRDTYKAVNDPFVGSNIVYSNHIYPKVYDDNEAGYTQAQNWNRWFGEATKQLPIMVTEFGWEPCDAVCDNDVLVGTTSGFGKPFMRYMESEGKIMAVQTAGWTAWVADYCLGPRMFDQDGSLLGLADDPATPENETEIYQGAAIRSKLNGLRGDYLPAPIGTAPGIPELTNQPVRTDQCGNDFAPPEEE